MRFRFALSMLMMLFVLPFLHASVVYSFTGASYVAGTTFQVITPTYFSLTDLDFHKATSGELVVNGMDYGKVTDVAIGYNTFPYSTTGLVIAANTPTSGAAINLTLPFTIDRDGIYSGAVGTLSIQSTPAVTPEPSSLLLLGTGMLGGVAVVRRRLLA